MIVITTKQ